MSIHTSIEKTCIYFVTFTCYKCLHLIELTKAYDEVYKFSGILNQHRYPMLAYAIMPNHLHFLVYFEKKNQFKPMSPRQHIRLFSESHRESSASIKFYYQTSQKMEVYFKKDLEGQTLNKQFEQLSLRHYTRGNAPLNFLNEIIEVAFQTTNRGYITDDLLVVAKSEIKQHRLFVQIKNAIYSIILPLIISMSSTL